MNNILMYCHNGSGNHGCEAIIRSTVEILSRQAAWNFYQISRDCNEDRKYGIHELVELLPEYGEVPHDGIAFLHAYLEQKVLHNSSRMDRLSSSVSFQKPYGETVSLSIGGDNYCYKGYKLYTGYHDISKKQGHKTVLWGCSVEPDFLEFHDLLADLKTFNKIVVRESISYEAMRKKGLENIVLYPDPAFTLEMNPMAEKFPPANTVGINISPMALDYGSDKSDILGNYVELIQYILRETDMNIALIPHVVWSYNDDRLVLQKLKDHFSEEKRVFMLEDMDCTCLKAYISKLRFFVGARTHATIAAYSTGVPTLVVGYSVKSRGIAKDIFGTEEHYVISTKEMKETSELTDAFKWIQMHENEIAEYLTAFMPAYIAKSFDAGKEIAELISSEKQDKKLKPGISKDACIGCESCISICPKNCLKMKSDSEGFHYPVITSSKCIDCELCSKHCPIKMNENKKQIPVKCYAAKNSDEDIRMKSSSGGVFSVLAKSVLKENGVVFGAEIDSNGVVRHRSVENLHDLACLYGAKYSQSKIGDTYQEAKKCLDAGRKVLFSGTPCQIGGLKAYLGKDYDTLICVDFICHGVPSPEVWKRYLNEIADGKDVEVNFRSKESGWSRYQYSLCINDCQKTLLSQKNNDNVFLQGMVKEFYLRPSCSACKFKGFNHPGDITVGDFWGIWDFRPDFDDNKGVSAVIVNTDKGIRLMEFCSSELITEGVSLADIRKNNISWIKSAEYTRNRKVFFNQFKSGKSINGITEYINQINQPKKGIIDKLYNVKHFLLRR